jgi:hypothetical protein
MDDRQNHGAANPFAFAKTTPARQPAAGAAASAAGNNHAAAAAARNPNAPIPVPKRPGVANLSQPDDEEQAPFWTDMFSEAPAWLVSACFHTLVLIGLGVWAAVAAVQSTSKEVEIQAEPMRYAEQIGDQLNDPSVLEPQAGKGEIDEKAEKQILTAQNMQPVDDPFAAPPPAVDIGLGGRWAASDIEAPSIGLALTGRQAGTRNVLLGKYGGNATTEGAVMKALEWLVKNQRADGTWSLLGPYSDGAVEENSNAATAMALLAFQGQGSTHKSGKYAKVVDKGWMALLKTQDRDGFFGRSTPSRQGLYTHAQCSIALCEVFGMTKDSRFYEPAQRAIAFCVKAQDKVGGGWRYDAGVDSDTSVTGWFVMALQSARMAKLEVPETTLRNVSRYLDAVAAADGKYSYTPGTFTTQAVTAEALLCREYLGWKQNDPRLVDGCKALNNSRVNYSSQDRDVYYWYYATQACHHMEGEIWNDWNKLMRQEVPAHQVASGAEAGSWDPRGDKWGASVGRLYVTCLSTFMLEVYYRHLPIYSGYRFVSGN